MTLAEAILKSNIEAFDRELLKPARKEWALATNFDQRRKAMAQLNRLLDERNKLTKALKHATL